jgi:hypothetical protein
MWEAVTASFMPSGRERKRLAAMLIMAVGATDRRGRHSDTLGTGGPRASGAGLCASHPYPMGRTAVSAINSW